MNGAHVCKTETRKHRCDRLAQPWSPSGGGFSPRAVLFVALIGGGPDSMKRRIR